MIVFKKISIKNFLSIGNAPIEINLNNHNITLVTGENGTAKSAICIDAIFYALYGKSFRKVSLQNMINSTNKKELLVELDFEINQNKYKIIRGIKPNKFEIYINDVMKPQMPNVKDYQNFLMSNIIKMDEKTFKQLVIVGSTSYTPFMLLGAAERRTVVEDLLRIDIFSFMKEHTKQFVSDINTMIYEAEHQIDKLQMQIEIQKKNDEDKIRLINESIEIETASIRKYEEEKDNKEKELSSLDLNVDEAKSVKSQYDKLTSDLEQIKQYKYKFAASNEETQKHKKFFSNHNVCPTCTQQLDPVFVKNKLVELQSAEEKFHTNMKLFDSKIAEIESLVRSNKERLDKFTKLYEQMNSLKREIQFIMNQISSTKQKIDSLVQKKNNTSSTSTLDVQKIENELEYTQKELEAFRMKSRALQYITKILKDDGVKSIIIKNYLPVINMLIKKYLEIIGYDIGFEFDENFNESVKAVNQEKFEYNNYSEGQKLRINSAIMFTFREIARIQSSISTNILVLDEYDGGTLDQEGQEAIVDILKSCSDTNIFIISHSPDYYSSIADKHIIVKRNNGFSYIENE